MSIAPSYQELVDEVNQLRRQLEDADALAQAIRENRVDAFVVTPDHDERVLVMQGVDHPYRRFVDCMQQGALTVTPDGTIAYVNPSLEKMLRRPATELVGGRLVSLVPASLQSIVDRLLVTSRKAGGEAEVLLWTSDGGSFPAHITASPVVDYSNTLCIIVTDLTLAKQLEADRIRYMKERLAHAEAEKYSQALLETEQRAMEELERRVEERTAQLRKVTLELMQTEQRERKRLAQFLHDDIQQLLAALKMEASRIAQRGANLGAVVDLADRSIKACRALTVHLSPPVLHEGDFVAALHWLGREMEAIHRLTVAIDVRGALPELSDRVRTELFNIARELLFNVVKHSGVDRATIRCSTDDKSFTMEVADQGKGCDATDSASEIKHSFGLSSIRERTAMLGGSLQMSSAPGKGCRVRVSLPLDVLGSRAA